MNTVAVAHDDAAVYKIVVYLICIGHLGQEEVCIGGVNLLAYWQHSKCLHHAATLLKQNLNPVVNLVWILESLECLLLGKLVYVIRILHLIKYRDDFL